MDIPKKVQRDGRTLNCTGPGRAKGAHCFVDPARSELLELFVARIFSTGPHFSLARVPGNEALESVYVSADARNGHGQPQEGDEVLIGPVSFPGGEPRARRIWALKPRRTGVITYVADDGDWAKLDADQGGGPEDVFVHKSHLQEPLRENGARFYKGARLSFVLVENEEGPAAHDAQFV
jgi:cold shock CspA family protein